MTNISSISKALNSKLTDARKAESDAYGEYKGAFDAFKAAKAAVDTAQKALDDANRALLTREEEIAPMQQKVAPFARRAAELQRAINVLPLMDALSPFESAFSALSVADRRKIYAQLDPIRNAVTTLARSLKDDKSQPVLGADAKKLTEKVWNAVETEINFAREIVKREQIAG